LVETDGKYTVALDITITEDLKQEGFARELINKIQNYRKEQDFNVTDKINVTISSNNELSKSVNNFSEFIKTQTLAEDIVFSDNNNIDKATEFDINGIIVKIKIQNLSKN